LHRLSGLTRGAADISQKRAGMESEHELPGESKSARNRSSTTLFRDHPWKPAEVKYSSGNSILPFRRVFYPLGYAVEIQCNDDRILVAAQESFGHRRPLRESGINAIPISMHKGGSDEIPAEPFRYQFSHLYSLVADRSNVALLDLRRCSSSTWLSESAVRNRLYVRTHFLEKVVYILLGSSVVTDIHAACVGQNGKGILLCGESGAGKSTLAYACARAGWTYTSDDTSYMINASVSPRVIGHAHRVRFRPSARELFPELRQYQVSPRLEGKPSIEVSVAELPITNTAAETLVHAVVFLQRSSAAVGRLVPLKPGTAVRRLCSELFSVGDVRAKHAAQLGALSDTPAYDLHYEHADDGIRALESLVQNA
jgi:hypothetical protein